MFKLVTVIMFMVFQLGCHLDSNTSNGRSSRQSTRTPDQTRKYSIDARVLEAIKTNIGDFSPMRGGFLLGVVNNNDVEIRYFLHDYASPESRGAYRFGDNINQNLAIAINYKLSDNTYPIKNFLGHVHSAPGEMNYALPGHEDAAESSLKNATPAMDVYIMGIVTIGSSTMKTLASHELKLSDNAKISFFAKARGEKFQKISVVKKPESPLLAYQRMHSYVNAIAHVLDAKKHLNLRAEGLKEVTYLYHRDKLILNISSSNKSIDIKIDATYPTKGPTLICSNQNPDDGIIDFELDREKAPGDFMLGKVHKNFEQFLSKFIQTKCPL